MRTAMVVFIVLGLVGSLLAADQFIGTWKINSAKSGPMPPPKSGIVKIEARENGLKVAFDYKSADGKVTRTEYTAKYDGKDYPVTGNANVEAVALARTDANTIEAAWKKGGTVIERDRGVVSNDGKTLTVTSKGKNVQGQEINNIIVFDKQ